MIKEIEKEYSKENPDIKELEFKFKTRKTDLNARQMGLCHLKRDCQDFVEMYSQLLNQMNTFKVHRAMQGKKVVEYLKQRYEELGLSSFSDAVKNKKLVTDLKDIENYIKDQIRVEIEEEDEKILV